MVVCLGSWKVGGGGNDCLRGILVECYFRRRLADVCFMRHRGCCVASFCAVGDAGQVRGLGQRVSVGWKRGWDHFGLEMVNLSLGTFGPFWPHLMEGCGVGGRGLGEVGRWVGGVLLGCSVLGIGSARASFVLILLGHCGHDFVGMSREFWWAGVGRVECVKARLG